MNKKTILKSVTTFTSIICLIALSSCTNDTYRESASGPEPAVSTGKSVSKSDRNAYRKALTALNNKDLDEAERLFDQFIHNKPKLAGGYSNLALIYLQENDLDKSLELVNKALELNTDQTQALNLRAQLYIKYGKIDEAKKDYLKAVKIKPSYINAQYNLALLYDVYLQEIALAIKHYKIYLSLIKKPDTITQDWVTHLEGTLKNG
jgi:tetratricopeptide (TPR) repeat protein